MNLTAANTARRTVVAPDWMGAVRMVVSPSELEAGDRVLSIEQRDVFCPDFYVERISTGPIARVLGGSRVVGARDLVEIERRVPWVRRPMVGAS